MKKQWPNKMTKANIFSITIAIAIVFNCVCISVSPAFAVGSAEEEASKSSDAWRHKPPQLPEPRPFKLPEIVSYNLPNGLSVQLLPDHRVPFITVAVGFKFGSVFDPVQLLGRAGMTADMLTEGTTNRNSKQIANEVDFIGGALRAGADSDNTILSGSALSKYTPQLLDIFSDVLLHPSFPDDELKLKKTNLIHELAIKRSEPEFLVDERFSKVVFGDHPYSVIAPSPETVAKITREDLINFHSQYYSPNVAALVVVGDFDLEKMKSLIDEKFAGWKAGSADLVALNSMPPMPIQKGKSIYLVDRPESVQSSIKLGNTSITKTDPDYFPLLVANQILGGATNSRLFLNIREQKGYTYGAYSGMDPRRQPGAFRSEAEVRTDVTALALQEFLYELERLRNVKVTGKELTQAKAYLAGSFQLGLETQSALVVKLLERRLYDLPSDYLQTYVDKVMAVTPDQIRVAARKHVDLDNIVISVVGDAKKIKPDLEYFADVTVYDADGKLIDKSIALKDKYNQSSP